MKFEKNFGAIAGILSWEGCRSPKNCRRAMEMEWSAKNGM